MKTTRILFMALLSTLLFASCSGKDGANGEQGIQGEPGKDGNANVQKLTIDTSQMSGALWTIEVPEITNQVIQNSSFLFFLDFGGSYYFVPGAMSTDPVIDVAVTMSSQQIELDFYDVDNNPFEMPAGIVQSLAVVITEATELSSQEFSVSDKLENMGINSKDFNAVKAFYNLD